MEDAKFYLRPNVQPEPLFNNWYAWPHLIAPATAAMNVANSHLKIMKSYVAAPQVHAAAVKNPAMRGGPFIDYEGKRVAEIKTLIDRVVTEQGHMLEFAQAVAKLNETLLKEAKGYTLEPLYEHVPEQLKGYVELVYDLNNQPSVRFIESLLYASRYYDPALQSISLGLVEQDEQPFVLSTPRLEDERHIHVKVPFKDEAVTELFKTRETPQPLGYIKELLGVNGGRDELLHSFFTEQHSPGRPKYDGDKVRVRYLGHACILIETKDVSVMTDPVLSYSYENQSTNRYTYLDLPETIDYVLITHGHADHLMFESLLQLRHKIRNIVVPRNGSGQLEDPSLRLILKNVGFKNVIEVDEMDTIDIDGGTITAVPFVGEHADLNIRTKTAYLVRLGDASIMGAADSSNLEPRLYKHIHSVIGDVDVMFLGMECDGAPLTWIYGSLLTKPIDRKMDQSRRLCGSDFSRAIDIVEQFNCKQVYVYAMGQEPWLSYLTSIKYTEESKPIVESDKLVQTCMSRSINSERLYCLKEIFL